MVVSVRWKVQVKGRREAWCRRKNYIVKCMHEKKFGRAELNFGPGRWASVLMCCQDVADHRMQPETLGKLLLLLLLNPMVSFII